MIDPKLARRAFLQKAGQTLAALPLLSVLPEALEAQTPAKPVVHVKPAAPKSFVHLNVRDFGATGDGTTKDTFAVQQALDRCTLLGGGEVLVPAGDYLTGALQIRSNTTLRIEDGASLLGSPDLADYPLTQVRWEGKFIRGYVAYIYATNADNISIVGKGKIIGSAAIKGRTGRMKFTAGAPVELAPPAPPPGATGRAAYVPIPEAETVRHPALIEFTSCKNVLVQDVFTQGNDMWSTHPIFCENVTFKNVTVHSGADGIDVDSCKNVTIDGCEFETRDDCISLKSGRGEEGNTIARPTEDVTISNCTFTDAYWACIGIGSETSAGIRNVHVKNCKCIGARTYAIYLKSRVGRGAFIENIYMDGLEVSGAKQGFLNFNFLSSGKQDEVPVPGLAGIPTVRNINFTNIHVTDEAELVNGTGIHPDKPVEGLSLTNISGTCGKGISLANARNVVIRNITVTGFTGPLLSIHNVTGTGLAGAAQLAPPKPPPSDVGLAAPTPSKMPEPIPEPATPYILK